MRHIRAAYGKTRLEERMVSHTGFLTFGRKALAKLGYATDESGDAEEAAEETGDEAEITRPGPGGERSGVRRF
ncbi:MAG: hypothetical protein R3B51_05190 [Thermodesulfobacteriota bacterium]